MINISIKKFSNILQHFMHKLLLPFNFKEIYSIRIQTSLIDTIVAGKFEFRAKPNSLKSVVNI